jgi:glycosyltransferase involved in cell wall biosynthesis
MYYARHGWAITVVLTAAQLDSEITALLSRAGAKLLTAGARPVATMGLPHRFPASLLWDLASARDYLRAARPDLVVVSTGAPWLRWGLVCFAPRFLYVLHTVPWVATGKPFRALAKRLLIAPWLGPTRRVLTVSDFAKRAIVAGWTGAGSSQWIEVVPSTTSLECAPLPTDGAAHVSRPLRVLTAGHVTDYKNPLRWLDIAERVAKQAPDLAVEFVWAGDGELLDVCIREIAHRRIEKSVRMLGYVAAPDSLYHQCDVYFQPSLIESQGLAVVEAMKHGVPCVVSNNGALPESVVDRETGYVVDMEDPQQVVDVLLELLRDGSKRHVMAQAAVARYESNYSASKWDQRMTKLLAELVAGTPPEPVA